MADAPNIKRLLADLEGNRDASLPDDHPWELANSDVEALLSHVRALEAERDRLKEGIDRLALPIAFGPTGMPDQETVARMAYAHAIARGRAPEQAEWDAFAALNGGGDGE
ncbi:hypothetical protein [Oceaniradius stylonematis]|uniref:hypothetical protein n=1 Tax=Oceaniradius stylonematis TaxID=2184161 RepID=UPI00273F498C|nr:hypothetical protein [Oceaniradius stylonematis]